MNLILIAGMPATGKSTLAKRIGNVLNLPIFEKDEIKEALFDTIGYADLTEKRRLDTAATAVLLRCIETLLQHDQSLIAVNNFTTDDQAQLQAVLTRHQCHCVTVFLNGDPDTLYARYVERDKRRTRHLGHTFIDRYPPLPQDDLTRSMTREYFADRFEKQGMADFRIDGTRIDVDATHPETINVDALITAIQKELIV